eukprot:14227562-Alexandrium_andersonii.AAC.2
MHRPLRLGSRRRPTNSASYGTLRRCVTGCRRGCRLEWGLQLVAWQPARPGTALPCVFVFHPARALGAAHLPYSEASCQPRCRLDS